MFIKRVKRKCSVRGCKNTDCFAISRTHEIGNTVIICQKCADDVLNAINEIGPDEKTNAKRQLESKTAPPLFFGDTANIDRAESEKTKPKAARNKKESKEQ